MFKSKALEKDQNAAANAAELVGTTMQEQHSVVEQPPPKREPNTNVATRSCIGSGMSIVGNVDCNGPAQVFGRVKGELRASDLLIGDGAQIEGSIIARTSQSAAMSRAPSAPFASNCRTVVRSRATFFTGRY
jgi:NDP-sugar pyrophosphorylase family protein